MTKAGRNRPRNQLNRSKDGVDRVSLKVDFRLTLEDMALYLTASHKFITNDDDTSAVIVDRDMVRKHLTSRATVVKEVQDYLWREGTERASYIVGDQDLGHIQWTLEHHLSVVWCGVGLEGVNKMYVISISAAPWDREFEPRVIAITTSKRDALDIKRGIVKTDRHSVRLEVKNDY